MRRLQLRLERLPIRLRLTVWYAVLLAGVLVLFGAALWIGLRIRLESTFDDQLRGQAAVTMAAVQAQGGALTIEPGQLTAARREGAFLRLLARDGHVVADADPALGVAPLKQDDVAAVLAGESRFSSARAGSRLIRIVSVPVPNGGATIGVLQVGTPRNEVDEVMHELLVAIAVAAPAAVLVALVGGHLLARRALTPVVAITRLASGIGGNDLHARLNVRLPNDELGQLAATFDGMLGRVEAAFERQRRFTGDAAHELRTPLALMRGRIDLARARPRTEEEHLATLDGLDGDLARLNGVVGGLLMLARSDNGQLAVEREAFDLADTITRIAAQYTETAAADIALQIDATPTLFAGDEDLIVQLLVNLVDNALAHTPPEGMVTLGCRPDATTVRLWVADTGLGIAREHQARVFDRFYRVDAGRTRRAGGVGLGLSVCRGIVEAHGGAIELQSAMGQGTRVDVTLPIRRAGDPRGENQTAPAGA